MGERTAGIDLASEEHRVVVVEGDGRRREERRYAHSEDGVAALVRRLAELDVARVAIEQPNGLVVDRLLEARITVVAVHPNQLAACRDRYRSGGGKSDGFDAYVLAELASTDMHRLRVLEPDRDETRALRALTRAREDLVEQRIALANQLRAQLDAFWPGAARIFSEVDSPITLAFLERYPSPENARLLGEKRLAAFLARHGYCGRRSAAELLARLRAAPEGRAGELEQEARRAIVLGLVAALKPIVEQIKLLTSEIRGLLADHPERSSVPSSATRSRSSPPPSCSPRSATAATATPPAARSKRSPVKPRSPSNPARKRSPASAGPATRPSAAPSASSPTAAASTTPGRTTSTNAPEREATSTRTRSASSAAPGCA
jgi:transposase